MDAIGDAVDKELEGVGTTFIGHTIKAIECRSELLIFGGIGKKISGDIPGNEVFVRKVLLIGPHDPVAVRPGGEIHVGVVAPGVSVAGGIEPIERHVLGVFDGGEEGIHSFFVSLGRG